MAHENPYTPPQECTPAGVGPKPRRVAFLDICAIIFLGGLLAIVVVSQPRLNRLLADFDVSLPAISVLALAPPFAWMVWVLLLAVIVDTFIRRERQKRTACNLVAVVVGLLAAVIYALGSLLPLLSLMQGLSTVNSSWAPNMAVCGLLVCLGR